MREEPQRPPPWVSHSLASGWADAPRPVSLAAAGSDPGLLGLRPPGAPVPATLREVPRSGSLSPLAPLHSFFWPHWSFLLAGSILHSLTQSLPAPGGPPYCFPIISHLLPFHFGSLSFLPWLFPPNPAARVLPALPLFGSSSLSSLDAGAEWLREQPRAGRPAFRPLWAPPATWTAVLRPWAVNGRVCPLGLPGRAALVPEPGIGCLGTLPMTAVKAEVPACVPSPQRWACAPQVLTEAGRGGVGQVMRGELGHRWALRWQQEGTQSRGAG